MSALEAQVAGGVKKSAEAAFVPAWRRLTEGEPRWQVTVAIGVALTLQGLLPEHLVLGPRWLLPSLGGALVVALFATKPGRRINRTSNLLRGLSLAVIATISVANGYSAYRLIDELLQGGVTDATRLLLTGGAIWLTNVIAFSLWYWEFDRGGPAARAMAMRPYPDFQFPQMEDPQLAPKDWEPFFVDYFYLSFTNATAFSPTDVMPLSRWAKLTMLAQSCVSLLLVLLVIARAVNILK
ncbi:MAG: hypothetical protein JO148_15155 [Acidimicrobiia bacterium]|nr:hypothetical protein [Acidimicrobiia bacterium]